MSQWRANSREVVFHTLKRGQRDTRLCTYLVSFSTLYYLPLSQTRSLPIYPLSLLHPIPVLLRYHLCSIPCPCQVKSHLPPIPNPHLSPRFTLRLLTQVQKRSCSYELRDRVLPSPNLLFHRLKSRLLPCHHCWGVFPFTVCPLTSEPTCK